MRQSTKEAHARALSHAYYARRRDPSRENCTALLWAYRAYLKAVPDDDEADALLALLENRRGADLLVERLRGVLR